MPGTLLVSLDSQPVGTFTNISGDYNVFTFEDSYREDTSRPVLSQGLLNVLGEPIRVVPRTHTIAPSFFANLLPEPDSLLRSLIARQHRMNVNRDFPFLHVLGMDLPGAVVVAGSTDLIESGESRIDEVAAERPIRFSLAGMQLKFSASMLANRLTIPMGGRGGSWIVKLPTNTYPRLPENEYAVMELARSIGLDVPKTDLVRLDQIDGLPADLPALHRDEPLLAYIVQRFDRPTSGNRLHFEDLNQVANQKPKDKYENKTMQWVGNVIATLCPADDVDEFVRRLIFGICVGNNDMHLKNWAIAYPDRQNARIAPLYDFVCTRQYFPHGELALTVAGNRAFEGVDRESIASFARLAEISSRRAMKLADETVDAILSVWPSYKREIRNEDLVAALDRQFATIPLISRREKHV